MRGLQSLAWLACIACRPAADAALDLGGTQRHYELFVPVEKPGMPLVIALHGNGGSGRQMRRLSQLDRIAEREGFVVAYPDGIDRHWNDGRPELETGVDDVAFIAGMIEELASDHAIDRTRVYVTGLSNGAMMSFRLGCDLADRIAAIAPVAGMLPAQIRCEPSAPVSLLLVAGTDDPLVPYEGGTVARDRGEVLSAAMSVDRFARRAHCGAPITRDIAPGAQTIYPCEDGVGVELITIEGGGHAWPRDSAARIWEFFKPYSRTPGIPGDPR